MDIVVIDQKLKFDSTKAFFLDGLNKRDLDLSLAGEKFSNNDEVIKTAVEHSFRVYLIQNLKNLQIDDMKRILDLSIIASQKKLCLPTTPIFLLSDMLTSLTIDKCSEIFCYLEDSANIWKSDLFYSSVKNYLLRMCNDLLKRLSKSQNTVFSGRIHLFLAKLFPLNEKSGLNLMSYFSDNFTRFTTNPATFEEAINKNKSEPTMETDESDESKIINHSMPIDFNLYTRFWSLQEIFCKPNQCYDKTAWKTFTNNANEVLEALKSYKLEEIKDENSQQTLSSALPIFNEEDDVNLYFSKYLTSEKLLDLQLNDSNFRRQVLIQFLILFQYLNSDVKFKSAAQTLNEEQITWIKSAHKKVIDLLRETPPLGYKFAQNVKHILEREDIWNKWKNEGCPNFAREKRTSIGAGNKPKRIKPVCADFIATTTTGGRILDGSLPITQSGPQPTSVLGKLCQVNHGNLEACRDSARQFLPSIKEFFEEAIDQLDPNNQVEKTYWLIMQPDWAWKALRLLAKRSPHYFMQVNQNVKPINEYLEAICVKLGKEYTAEQQKQQAALLKQQQKEAKQQQLLQQQQQQQQQQQEVIVLEKDESPDSVKQEIEPIKPDEDESQSEPPVINENTETSETVASASSAVDDVENQNSQDIQ